MRKLENLFVKHCYEKKIDTKLKFKEHVETMCKNSSQKTKALAKTSSYTTFQQRKLIHNSFVISHFFYCPLFWMFHSQRLNNQINNIQERALQVITKITQHLSLIY